MLIITGITVTITALIVLLIAEAQNRQTLRWIAKPIASAGFILAAIGYGAFDTTFGLVMLTAFVFSFFGDIFLIPKNRSTFMTGLLGFGLAHIAYSTAFVIFGIDIGWTLLSAVLITLFIVSIGRWLYPFLATNTRIPLWLYLLVIGIMVSLAGGCTLAGGPVTILTGAVLFAVSDIAVARNKFVAPGLSNKLWGLPLYYLAQHILASSVGMIVG